MQKIALIVAGGKGERMKSSTPKQFLCFKGAPILMHTIKKFDFLDNIIVVLPSSELDNWKSLCQKYKFILPHTLVEGGSTRIESVRKGLKNISRNVIVAIHDGVRPLISKELINKLIAEVRPNTGAIPIIPVKDSLRKVTANNSISIDRSNMFHVQTPQCFLSDEIKEAYNNITINNNFTDDASIFEHNKGKIKTVLGEENNIKITTQQDLLKVNYLNI